MLRKVWRTERAGALNRLTLREETMDPLTPGRIRVDVKAAGLNFADLFALTGLYSATPAGSFIPGLEFAGVVRESMAGDCGIAQGDPMMGVIRFGGYASAVDVAPEYCRRLPPGWSFSQGAAFPAQTLTAWYALKELGAVKPGQRVLIQSAAGGVGLQAMQLCAKVGARPIGCVGNESKRAFLNGLGYHEVVVRGGAFRADVLSLTGGAPLDLVLDAVGGKVQRQSYELLGPTGRLVVFGAAEYTPGRNRPKYLRSLIRYLRRPRYDPMGLVSSNRSVLGFNLIWLWDRLDLLLPMLEEIEAMSLPPPHVGREFSFADARQALEHLRSGLSVGKVVITLP